LLVATAGDTTCACKLALLPLFTESGSCHAAGETFFFCRRLGLRYEKKRMLSIPPT